MALGIAASVSVCVGFHLQREPVIDKTSAIKTDRIIQLLINGNFIFPEYKDPTFKPLDSHNSFGSTDVDGLS